jgi:hypothetical protein
MILEVSLLCGPPFHCHNLDYINVCKINSGVTLYDIYLMMILIFDEHASKITDLHMTTLHTTHEHTTKHLCSERELRKK